MALDDAREGKHPTKDDFKVYVLRAVTAQDAEWFFRDERSFDNSRHGFSAAIKQINKNLPQVTGDELEQIITLNATLLEREGGIELRTAGVAISDIAQKALNYLAQLRRLNEQPPYLVAADKSRKHGQKYIFVPEITAKYT